MVATAFLIVSIATSDRPWWLMIAPGMVGVWFALLFARERRYLPALYARAAGDEAHDLL